MPIVAQCKGEIRVDRDSAIGAAGRAEGPCDEETGKQSSTPIMVSCVWFGLSFLFVPPSVDVEDGVAFSWLSQRKLAPLCCEVGSGMLSCLGWLCRLRSGSSHRN